VCSTEFPHLKIRFDENERMSQKPIYIPRNKRNRFHGAFTGGFSAGYYNSVGSKEGWKPMDESIGIKTRERTAHDYMDDQDFDEWGGPNSVQKEYSSVTSSENLKASAALDWSIVSEKKNVGFRLLRILGWREGSTAYVPEVDLDVKLQDTLNDVEKSFLSKKKLRKIRLEPKPLLIPPPKLDNSGLGYHVFHNAPEFQAHREKRRLEASSRASSALNGGYATYRVSDLLGKDVQQKNSLSRDHSKQILTISAEDTYTSQDTFQDLIGKKSASGFALQDDEDDVYEQNTTGMSSRQIDQNEDNTEIYDHDSSSDSNDDKNSAKDVKGILSAWATGVTDTSHRKLTSDGRPPLPGFIVADTTSEMECQRFPGPELPPMYLPKKHIFSEEDLSIYKSQIYQNFDLPNGPNKQVTGPLQPMAGGTFSSLSSIMKDRFTSGSAKDSVLQPAIDQFLEGSGSLACDSEKQEFKIDVTNLQFIPDLLVCKRLGVTPPSLARTIVNEIKPIMAESKFFEEQVMKRVSQAKSQASKSNEVVSISCENHDFSTVNRPSAEVYKSIYEPDSLSEEDENDQVTEEDEINEKIIKHAESLEMTKMQDNQLGRTLPIETQHDQSESSSDTNLDLSSSHGDRYRRKKGDSKSHKRKHTSRRKMPIISLSNNEIQKSDDADQRRQEYEKKKKKKKKRRYSDDSCSLSSQSSGTVRSVSSRNRKKRSHRSKKKRSKDSGKRQKNRDKKPHYSNT
jgi:hypothetical protein